MSLSIVLAFVASALRAGPIDAQSDAVVMVRVGGGPFSLGADGGAPDARPPHQVELRAFEIDRLPVVNAQFAAFLTERGTPETTGATSEAVVDLKHERARIVQIGTRYVALAGFEQYPVIAETWQGAREFCAARGARLPTEAEWERAARGPEGRAFPWGDELPDASRARFAYRPFDYYPVGSYPAGATPDGILDMAGNVAQWTSSRYAPYPYRSDDGREDPNAGGERVTRGGGSGATADLLRATYRSAGAPGGLSGRPPQTSWAERAPVTFRCARDAG